MGKSKSSLSRRDFLIAGSKAGALLSSGLLFSGCGSLDKAFSGEKKYLDDEVLILGAGAAGLAAAYTLKKNKIPFRVFEASSRVGGRVYTLQNFAGGDSLAELGCDSFDESHRRVQQICKELGLDTQEIKKNHKLEEGLYFLNGKYWSTTDLRKALKPLYAQLAKHNGELFSDREIILSVQNISQFDKAIYYDSLSAEDFINSLRGEVDAWLLDIFSLHVRNRFGVEVKALSALQLLQFLNREPGLNLVSTKNSYRVMNGMSSLTHALYDRVAGVIPDYVVKMESPLTRIRFKGSDFRLDFRTKDGTKSYTARQIICTIPFSTLREVEGVYDLPLTDAKKSLLISQVYATQSKGVIEFTDAFWKKKAGSQPAFGGQLSGDFVSQNFSVDPQEENGPALLSVLRGGTGGASATDQMLTEAVRDLEKMRPGVAALVGSHQNFMNWSTRPFNKGSRAVFAPGQFTKFSGIAEQAECNGQLLFAGEHVSTEFSGSLEGALSSGISAAENIVKRLREPAAVRTRA